MQLRQRSMRRLVLVLVATVLALPVIVATAPCAHACDCDRPTPESAIPGADLIGEVTVLDESEDDDKRLYELEVTRSWKGATHSRIELSTESDVTACGLELTEGERYILFAGGSEDEGWSSTWCTATHGVDAEDPPVTRADVEAELGTGDVPTAAPDTTDTTDQAGGADDSRSSDARPWGTVLGVAAGVGTLVALVCIGAGLLLHRRR